MSSFWFLVTCSCILPFVGFSQSYDTIWVGQNTSVNMIFDSPVQKWDMGLGVRVENGVEVMDVLVENPASSKNRIKLAAGIVHFTTTNLFIETQQGYYNFILAYDPEPQHLLIKVSLAQAAITKTDHRLDTLSNSEKTPPTQEGLNHLCKLILKKNEFTDIGEEKQDMLFYLAGIYIADDYLFFSIDIQNKGGIPFDLGYVGFFTGDKGKGGNKRKPKQLTPLEPVYVYPKNSDPVEPKGVLSQVYVFDRFTLASRHKLFIQFWEGNGGERKVELVVGSKEVLRAESTNKE